MYYVWDVTKEKTCLICENKELAENIAKELGDNFHVDFTEGSLEEMFTEYYSKINFS